MDQIEECRLEDLWSNLKSIEKLNVKYMDMEFVSMLNEFAIQQDVTLIINQGAATSGHSARSKHYQRPCKAIDFTYDQNSSDMELDDLFAFASNFISKTGKSFGAVGAYPFWNRPGLHVDDRVTKVYWLRDEEREYIYRSEWREIEQLVTTALSRRTSEIDFCDSDF